MIPMPPTPSPTFFPSPAPTTAPTGSPVDGGTSSGNGDSLILMIVLPIVIVFVCALMAVLSWVLYTRQYRKGISNDTGTKSDGKNHLDLPDSQPNTVHLGSTLSRDTNKASHADTAFHTMAIDEDAEESLQDEKPAPPMAASSDGNHDKKANENSANLPSISPAVRLNMPSVGAEQRFIADTRLDISALKDKPPEMEERQLTGILNKNGQKSGHPLNVPQANKNGAAADGFTPETPGDTPGMMALAQHLNYQTPHTPGDTPGDSMYVPPPTIDPSLNKYTANADLDTSSSSEDSSEEAARQARAAVMSQKKQKKTGKPRENGTGPPKSLANLNATSMSDIDDMYAPRGNPQPADDTSSDSNEDLFD